MLPDIELGTADALTSHTEELIVIAFRRSVHHAAVLGEGRARNTVAHELGHAVMHNRSGMPRRAGGNDTYRWVRPYESAEHQAKVFAAAFLIDDDIASTLDSAEEIAIQFGVSLKCAEIYYKELVERRDRSRAAEKIRKLAASFGAEVKQFPAPSLRFLDSPCPKCGERKVFPVGSKYMCQSCDTVSDTYPDGDSD
ncbi:ImmA/IrrE family metallo-endopeptidase [Methylocystis sp.]|uniref:ImmA/IrrE family metallo-endopeptidase n=1 Tax=Methylocystis sp. TaxID=1911079 RepID=UPI0025EC83C4|nr:ImmA/IrrE family metallo-endopeptidase [Methylocystis sp.]